MRSYIGGLTVGEVLLLLLLLLENTVGLVCCTPMVAESDPVQDKLWHVYCSSCIPHSFPTPFKHVTVWTPPPHPCAELMVFVWEHSNSKVFSLSSTPQETTV